MAEYYMWKHRLFSLVVLGVMFMTMLCGCKGNDVYFSDGLRNSELMKIDGHIVYLDEARLLLAESKHTYENAFNGNIWDEQIFNTTMEEYVKADIKDKLQKLEYYVIMAESMGIKLNDEEKAKAEIAADEYMKALDDGTEDELEISKNTVLRLYEEIALAEKTFYSCTSSVDLEVSVDEARVIDVQYIFIKTSDVDEEGNVSKFCDPDIKTAFDKIQNIKQMVDSNSDFSTLAGNESDDSKYELELGRGDYDTDFEKAAFELDSGEISDIVETRYGYYIIKCLEDSVEGMYEDQYSKIILERRKEIFNDYYTEVVTDSPVEINYKKWNGISIESLPVSCGEFFTIYNEQFDNYFN